MICAINTTCNNTDWVLTYTNSNLVPHDSINLCQTLLLCLEKGQDLENEKRNISLTWKTIAEGMVQEIVFLLKGKSNS